MTARLNGIEHVPLHAPADITPRSLSGTLKKLGAPFAIVGSLLLHVSLTAAFALGLARAGSEALPLSRPDAIAVDLVTLAEPSAEVTQALPAAPPPQIAAPPFAPVKPVAEPAPEPEVASVEPVVPLEMRPPPEAMPRPARRPCLAAPIAAPPATAATLPAPAAASKPSPPAQPRRAITKAIPRRTVSKPAPARAPVRPMGRVSPNRGTGIAAARPPSASASAGDGQYRQSLMRHVARLSPGWNGRAGAARLALTVNRAGRLTAAAVIGSSGQGGLDAAILAAARRAQPYPRPPATLSGDSFRITVTISAR